MLSASLLRAIAVTAAVSIFMLLGKTDLTHAQGLPEGYRLVDTWATRTPSGDVAQFTQPAGIDVAPDDTIFVVDQEADTVFHLSSTGAVMGRWQVDDATGAPRDVAASGDRVYVVGRDAGEIRTHGGQLLQTMALPGVTGVAVGPSGRVFVPRRTGSGLNSQTRIDVLDAGGDVVETWPDDPFVIISPRGIDVGPDGRAYLAADGAIYVFEDGSITSGIRVPSNMEAGDVWDVAVDTENRVFAVQGSRTRHVIVWQASTGDPLDSVAFSGAQNLAVGPGDGLILSVRVTGGYAGLAYLRHRSAVREEPQRWGDADQTLGQLVGPRRVATASNGDVYVVDKRQRVQRWSSAGVPLDQWPGDDVRYLTDVAGGADMPCAVGSREVVCLGPGQSTVWTDTPSDESWLAAADGNGSQFAAVDLAEQRVWIYSRAGASTGGWALSDPDGFTSISDIALDGGTVYLADRGAHRVRVVGLDGSPRAPGEIDVPGEAVRVAARDGALYALTREGWVWKYDASGALRSVWQPSPGGSPSDLAAGPGGRVYVTDPSGEPVNETQQGRVLVFEPGGTPPTSLPPQPDLSCVVSLDKRATPGEITIGETVDVTLSIGGQCPFGDGQLDIVLAIDQSGSMTGSPLAAAQAAAIAFLGQLDPNGARVSVVGFSTSASVLQPLTGNLRDVVRAVGRISAGGQTNYTPALELALIELTSPRARTDVPQIVVMMTDGKPTDRNMVLRAAGDLKGLGVTLYTIGLGPNVDRDLLRDMASEPELYFEAPTESELADVYGVIARRITASRLLRTGEVVDELPDDMTLVPDSVRPPARVEGRTLSWSLSDVRTSGTSLSYTVRPRRVGLHPTNVMAILDYVDATGNAGTDVFPVPKVNVLQPDNWPTFLPMVWKNRCKPQRADVVLVFDTSSSMTAPATPGSTATKLDAALQAGRVFLSAMQLPGDQAAIVTFDAESRRVQKLTGSRGDLELSLAGIRAGSGTRIDKGLEQAIVELFSTRRKPDNNPVIILLTDGLPAPDTEERVFDVARDAHSAGISVFTIGLGADADPDLLWLVAGDDSRTFLAPDTTQLAGIYEQIAGQVLCD